MHGSTVARSVRSRGVAGTRAVFDEGEDVVVELRPHCVFFLGPALVTVAAAAGAVEIALRFPHAPVAVGWVLVVMAVVPALWLAGRLARWFAIRLAVTDRRIVLRTGVFGRRVVSLRLQRVVDIHCIQGAFERLIGSGQLVFDVEGEEGSLVVDDVRRPRSLQRLLTSQLDAFDDQWRGGWPERPPSPVTRHPGIDHAGEPTPPAGVRVGTRPRPESVPDQLVALDDLRRRGILSEDEFSEKKQELLRRL
jgi:membrane protein YdbS with pleckstrin-like domain